MGVDLDRIDEEAVFIIGAGHFGARAARILSQRAYTLIFVVDPDEKSILGLRELNVQGVQMDGIQFLLDHFHLMKDANIIVPALPHHLAYEWLIRFLPAEMAISKVPVPDVTPPLPHASLASEGSTLVSYADFLCPDDCPEPVHCTVTGEKREQPLYALLKNIHVLPFQVHIIRSHQLAPGLGGYKAGDLREAADRIKNHDAPKWILGTACKCHGILTAFDINRQPRRYPRDAAGRQGSAH
jgi:hypothetical protein